MNNFRKQLLEKTGAYSELKKTVTKSTKTDLGQVKPIQVSTKQKSVFPEGSIINKPMFERMKSYLKSHQ
ncbi:MAG TPA: hypothetical protein VLH19_04390 [Patescibacteria group bacterium]|nr:hypothetical protein [Patescibacteria group bacterium]